MITTRTTIRSIPAIAGGTISATVAFATLIRDVGFLNIGLDHIQAAALVGLTVLAGHLATQAWQQTKLLAGSALLALAVVGSMLTVYNAMGNRAEVRDVKVASASLSDAERTRIKLDLDKTTKLVAEAEAWALTECKSGRGPKCDGVTFVLRQRQASQAALAAQLKNVGPVVVAEPKAAQVATLASLAGYDGATVKAAVSALEPLAFPLFLELLAIVLFSHGLGHRVSEVSAPQMRALEITETAKLTDPELEQLRKLLASHDALSNNELAHLLGVSKSESSKRVQKAVEAGICSRQRVGREVAITLH